MLRYTDYNGKFNNMNLVMWNQENEDMKNNSLKLICLNYIIENDINISSLELPVDILEPLSHRLRKEEKINDNNLQIFYPLLNLDLEMNPITDRGLACFAERSMCNVSCY